MSKTRPWGMQRGVERLMPLSAAIARTEQALIAHGVEIASGKHPKHQQAWAAFKNALDAVDDNWERCKEQAYEHPAFDQSYLVALDGRLKGWCSDVTQAVMNWVDWPCYIASGMPDRTRDLTRETQELEKRLYLTNQSFLDGLAQASDPPRLSIDELARLRAYLKAPLRLSELKRDPAERKCRRKLQEILNYNDELRRTETRDGPTEQAEKQDSEAPAKTYSVANLLELTGMSNTTLNKYAKLAEVTTPGRGKQNFRYSAANVRAILKMIIASTTQRKLLNACRKALTNLKEIAE